MSAFAARLRQIIHRYDGRIDPDGAQAVLDHFAELGLDGKEVFGTLADYLIGANGWSTAPDGDLVWPEPHILRALALAGRTLELGMEIGREQTEARLT